MLKISIRAHQDIGRLIAKLGDDFQAGVRVGVAHAVAEVEARVVKEAPVKRSNLVNAITGSVEAWNRGVVRVTDAAPYAIYVHEGTGLYGPHKQKIVPKNKKALYWPGAAHPVRSVKGQRPNPFFTRGIAKAKTLDAFREGLSSYLTRRGR